MTAYGLSSSTAFAQVFGGPGLQGGVNTAGTISGPVNRPIRDIVISVLRYVLDFLALVAVVMVIIAGIYLVASLGNDEAKNKAKTIIKYVVIGLIVILFARFIVSFFTIVAPQIIG